MRTREKQVTRNAPASTSGIDWRILSVWSGMATAAALLVFIAIIGEIIPPLVIFAVLYGVAVLLVRRGGRPGLIMTGVLSLLLLASNAPFIVPALSVLASTVDFVMTGLIVVLAVTNLVSAIAALRASSTGARAGLAGRAALAMMLLVVAVAVVGRLTYDSPPAQGGDVELTTQDIEFSAEVIEAEGGEVSVFVDNKDSTLHTFTVEDLDVDLQVPGGSTARVTFEASAGSYQFICRPHPDLMKGILEVN